MSLIVCTFRTCRRTLKMSAHRGKARNCAWPKSELVGQRLSIPIGHVTMVTQARCAPPASKSLSQQQSEHEHDQQRSYDRDYALCGEMQPPEADLQSIAHDMALHLKNESLRGTIYLSVRFGGPSTGNTVDPLPTLG